MFTFIAAFIVFLFFGIMLGIMIKRGHNCSCGGSAGKSSCSACDKDKKE